MCRQIDHYAGFLPPWAPSPWVGGNANGTREVLDNVKNYEILLSKMQPHQRAVLVRASLLSSLFLLMCWHAKC